MDETTYCHGCGRIDPYETDTWYWLKMHSVEHEETIYEEYCSLVCLRYCVG